MRGLVIFTVFFLLNVGFAMACLPEGYIRSEPPVELNEVGVGIHLGELYTINEKSQTFDGVVLLTTSWDDPRLAHLDCVPELDEIWNPEVVITNQHDISLTFEHFTITDGRVSLLQWYSGTFSVPLNLKEYPFDVHTLPVLATSFYDADTIHFVADPQSTGRRQNLAINSWDISEPHLVVTDEMTDFEQKTRSRALFTVEARRDPSFFFFGLMIPLLLIVFMSWTVFWLDPMKMLASQLSISIISMLNIIAYKFAFSVRLPEMNYLSRAELLFLGAAIIIFLSLVQTVMTGSLAAGRKVKIARLLDKYSRWIFPAVFIIYGLLVFLV